MPCTIDWAATGSMISGWGSFIGAGAVLYAANVGRSTFNDWKHQKNEGRRIDLAEQLLALAYKLKRVFEVIRSPAMLQWEIAETEQKLRENGLVDDTTPAGVKSGLSTAQATLSRADYHRPLFDSLIDTIPVAKAIFGDDIETALNEFWKQRAKVITAAQRYGEYVRRDERRLEEATKRQEKMEAVFWEGGGADGVDDVANAIDAAISKLERLLLPIIRHAN